MKVEFLLILGLKILGIGLNFAGLASLSNTMTLSDFGSFAAMFSAGLLVSLPAMAGLNFSLVRYTSETTILEIYRIGLTRTALAQLGKLLAGLWILGMVSGLVVATIFPQSANAYEIAAVLAFGLSYGFSEVLQSVARNFDGSVRAFVYREIGWRSSFFFVALVNVMSPQSMSGAAVMWLLTLTLLLTVTIQFLGSALRCRVPEEVRLQASKEQRDLWRKAPGFMLVGGLSTSSQHLIVILAGVALTLEATAHFFTAFKTMQILSLSILAVNFVLTPRLRNLRNESGTLDTELVSTVCTTSAWLNTLFCIAGIGLFAMGGNLLLSLFGPAFAHDRIYLLILSLAALLNAVTGPSGFVLVMFDRQKQFNVIAAVSMLSGAGLCVLGGSIGGIAGFCWGYVAWIAIQNVSMAYYAWYSLGINSTCLGLPDPGRLVR
jgi:O-antigen/teichoic acid export membrane protein